MWVYKRHFKNTVSLSEFLILLSLCHVYPNPNWPPSEFLTRKINLVGKRKTVLFTLDFTQGSVGPSLALALSPPCPPVITVLGKNPLLATGFLKPKPSILPILSLLHPTCQLVRFFPKAQFGAILPSLCLLLLLGHPISPMDFWPSPLPGLPMRILAALNILQVAWRLIVFLYKPYPDMFIKTLNDPMYLEGYLNSRHCHAQSLPITPPSICLGASQALFALRLHQGLNPLRPSHMLLPLSGMFFFEFFSVPLHSCSF